MPSCTVITTVSKTVDRALDGGTDLASTEGQKVNPGYLDPRGFTREVPSKVCSRKRYNYQIRFCKIRRFKF